MNTCSECGATYEDDMSFCLQDGTKLVGIGTETRTEAVTEVFEIPSETSQKPTEAVTDEWSNSTASRATVVKQPAELTNHIAGSRANVRSEPQNSNAGFFLGAVATIGLLLLGSAIGGIYWYFSSHKTNEIVAVNSNQPTNTNSNDSDENMRSELSNMEMTENTTDSNAKPVENVNAASTAIPKDSPKPEETKSPDINQTPTQKPSPKPSIEEIAAPTPTLKPTLAPVPKIISGGVLNGKATNLPQPRYPPAARAVKAQGSVSVQVLVDENGNVARASAVSGHPLLRNSAEQAARRAKFRPTELSGQAVKVTGVIVYNFN